MVVNRKTRKYASFEVESLEDRRLMTATAAVPLYNGLGFNNQPNLNAAGMKGIYIAYEWMGNGLNLLTADKSALNEAGIRKNADAAAALHQPMVLDVEAWGIDTRYFSHATVQTNLAKFAKMLAWVKDEQPNLKVSIYGTPDADSGIMATNAITEMDKAADAWRGINPDTGVYIASTDIISHMDFLAPQLYVSNTDITRWDRYSAVSLREAKRVSQLSGRSLPIYTFINTDYQPGVSHATLASGAVSQGVFSMALKRATSQSDGTVIWGGYNENWNSSAGWWKATQTYLSATAQAPAAPTAVAVNSANMQVNWIYSGTNESGFVIERSSNSGSTYSTVGYAAGGTRSWNDASFIAGTNYTYRVTTLAPLAHSTAASGAPVTASRNPYTSTAAQNYDDAFANLAFADGVVISNGWWVKYDNMQFGANGAGALAMTVMASNGSTNQRMEMHLDSLNGPLAGSVLIPPDGGWGHSEKVTMTLKQITGTHAVYFTFPGVVSTGALFSFQFAAYKAPAVVPAAKQAAVVKPMQQSPSATPTPTQKILSPSSKMSVLAVANSNATLAAAKPAVVKKPAAHHKVKTTTRTSASVLTQNYLSVANRGAFSNKFIRDNNAKDELL